jgi:hypothetical protein
VESRDIVRGDVPDYHFGLSDSDSGPFMIIERTKWMLI